MKRVLYRTHREINSSHLCFILKHWSPVLNSPTRRNILSTFILSEVVSILFISITLLSLSKTPVENKSCLCNLSSLESLGIPSLLWIASCQLMTFLQVFSMLWFPDYLMSSACFYWSCLHTQISKCLRVQQSLTIQIIAFFSIFLPHIQIFLHYSTFVRSCRDKYNNNS